MLDSENPNPDGALNEAVQAQDASGWNPVDGEERDAAADLAAADTMPPLFATAEDPIGEVRAVPYAPPWWCVLEKEADPEE